MAFYVYVLFCFNLKFIRSIVDFIWNGIKKKGKLSKLYDIAVKNKFLYNI